MAYTQRFGVAPDGVFANETGLSNGGEQLRLLAAGGGVIRDFEYDDEGDWPAATDGQGFRLVLDDPSANPDHSLAASWRASFDIKGSDGDWDKDGDEDLVELALGTDPTDPSERATVTGFVSDDHLAVTFTSPTVYTSIITVERSTDLVSWDSGVAFVELFSSTTNPDGTTTVVYRSTSTEATREYMRLRILVP